MQSVHTPLLLKHLWSTYEQWCYTMVHLWLWCHHVDNLQITISTVTTAIALLQFPSLQSITYTLKPCMPKEPTNNKHFQRLYHQKLSGKSLMVSWGFHMGMRRVCCETIPKHWCFSMGCQHVKQWQHWKPVTLKPLVNIYPCETRNHIFNTNFIDLLWYSGENCGSTWKLYFHRLAPTSLWI